MRTGHFDLGDMMSTNANVELVMGNDGSLSLANYDVDLIARYSDVDPANARIQPTGVLVENISHVRHVDLVPGTLSDVEPGVDFGNALEYSGLELIELEGKDIDGVVSNLWLGNSEKTFRSANEQIDYDRGSLKEQLGLLDAEEIMAIINGDVQNSQINVIENGVGDFTIQFARDATLEDLDGDGIKDTFIGDVIDTLDVKLIQEAPPMDLGWDLMG